MQFEYLYLILIIRIIKTGPDIDILILFVHFKPVLYITFGFKLKTVI